MVSHIEGERFIIVGTLDAVEADQEFERIPPHMTIVRWFQMSEHHRHHFLERAMDNVLTDQDVYQNLIGGQKKRYGEGKQFPVREIQGAEIGPWHAFHSLVSGVGYFREDDIYAHHFAPHVTDTPDRHVRRREQLAIPTVALISAHSEKPAQRVLAAFTLGQKDNG